MSCKHCEFIEKTFGETLKQEDSTNREYWIMTEVFYYLHKSDQCPARKENQVNKRIEISGLMFLLMIAAFSFAFLMPKEVMLALDGEISPRETFGYLKGVISGLLLALCWFITRKVIELSNKNG